MKVVLIPAYEPDCELIKLTQQLKAEGFSVLTVDDGSGEKYRHIFDSVKEYATVIALDKNSGKGAALKFGMRYIRSNMPDCEAFITCDADGQHKVEDVVRVANMLDEKNSFVLTVRRRKKGIPLRSKVGNDLSRFVYALLADKYLSDNQSGLRGFNIKHIDWLIEVEKDNYDYEMNVLFYAAKKSIKISTLMIESIYINNNASSHFNPIGDTIKIYKGLFTRAFGKFIAFAVCEILVLIASIIFGYEHLSYTLPVIGAVGYALTILLNMFIFFRKTEIYEYRSTLIYTVIYYFFYTLSCTTIGLAFPQIPLFAAFNFVYLVFIPIRFFFHKFIAMATTPKE